MPELGTGLSDTSSWGDFSSSQFSGLHMENRRGVALTCLKTAATIGSKVASTASSSAGPYGAMAGSAINFVCGVIDDSINTYDAQKTVAKLRQVYSIVSQDSGIPFGEKRQLHEIVDYALAKKEKGRNIHATNIAQVTKLGTNGYRAGQAIYKKVKGTKGANREKYADDLFALAKSNNKQTQQAAAAIIEILGKQKFESIIKNSIKESLRSE